MKALKALKFNLLVISMFMLLSVFMTGEALSATYYVATNGSDSNNGSSSSPWATFIKAMQVIQPGDTLFIKDGIYYQSLDVTVSGVTVKAVNDGGAIIDGQYARTSFRIDCKSDITIEGLRFQNSNYNVIDIGFSKKITLKRITAYNTSYNVKASVIALYQCENILLEDCTASGWGRNMFMINESDSVTLRRCWGAWKGWYDAGKVGGDNLCVQLYGTSNSIVENFVCTRTPDAMNVEQMGVNVWCNDWNADASNNKYVGSVIYGLTSWAFNNSSCKHRTQNNSFINNVSMNNSDGFIQRGDANAYIQNMTFAGTSHTAYLISPVADSQQCQKEPDYALGATIKNVSFVAGMGLSKALSSYITHFNHQYNNYYNLINLFENTTGDSTEYCLSGCGNSAINPSYNTSVYGKGAYLMVPPVLKGKGEGGDDIGAEVLYRYQNGVLTNIPLWPWPMEDRIFRETGVSVTWEANGGLWKTLDGVYAGTPVTPTVDTTPPSIPTGLTATSVSSSQINFSWTASTDNVGVAGYKVYRNGTQIATTSNTNYSDTGLSPSTTYTYKVAAYDAAGNNSNQSGSVSVSTQATPDTQAPTIPNNLTAITISSTQMNFSWTASTDNVGVAGYKVYRNGTQIATTSNTNYSDTGLSPSTTYTYTVSAYDAAGNNSNQSTPVSVTTFQLIPDSMIPLTDFTYISDLQWIGTPVNGWGPIEIDKSNGGSAAGDGLTITLNGVSYTKGIGVHANSEVRYNLGGKYSRFISDICIDDEAGNMGSVVFQVWADGMKIYDSGIMTGSSAIKKVDVDVTGKDELKLIVTNAGDNINYDHADWAGAYLINVPVNVPVTYISDLQWIGTPVNGWGPIEIDKSNGGSAAGDGLTITLNGTTYAKGLGVHAASDVQYNLAGKYSTFMSDIGVDDESGNNGSVVFQVFADGVKLYDSGAITGSSQIKKVTVDITGKNTLQLVVANAGDGITSDHGDWADARLAVAPLPDTTPPAAPKLY